MLLTIIKQQANSNNKYREPGHIKRASSTNIAERKEPKLVLVGPLRSPSKSSSQQPIRKKPRINSSSSGLHSSASSVSTTADLDSSSVGRTKRESTKAKSSDAEQRMLELEKVAAVKRQSMQRVQPLIRHQFTQRELLIDALETEVRYLVIMILIIIISLSQYLIMYVETE